jgi:methyl-accepting chemotaxis protein
VLAHQTREATHEIETHIAQVKAAVSASAASLQRLGNVIAGVDQAASAIFTATDAQVASTRQLVERIAEVSLATRSVVEDTQDAQEMAGETERISTAVLDAVAVIDEQADLLREKIASFVLQLRGSGSTPPTTPQDLSEPELRALAS